MTIPGLGGQQAPAINAPAGEAPTPGVTPGVSRAVVIANTVLVFGPSGAVVGIFVYALGTIPAAGNQPIVAITNQAADPYGNAIPAPGVTVSASASVWANLNNGVLSFNAVAGQASQAGIASSAAGVLAIESGLVSGGDTQAEIGLLSAVANGGTEVVELIASQVTITGSVLSVAGSTHTTINGVSSPGIVGTSGAASAGTAHTHSAGSYTLGSGQHQHSSFGG